MPPFPGSIAKIFQPKKTPFKHSKLFPFLALKAGQPVGRIAAIINPNHNAFHQDRVGFFGFFDFIDDAEVSRALLNTAQEILRTEGMNEMRGPFSPSINDECGLLIDGYDARPLVMMPYNPPYYLTHYEKLGLKRVHDLYAFTLSANHEAPERIKKIVDRVKKRSGITIRNVDMKNLPRDLEIIRNLYNSTLERNWGFVPLSKEEIEGAAEDLKSIVDPSMVLIGERNGTPMGFSLTLPDINEFMHSAGQSKGLLRILKFIWLLKTSHPKRARLTALGVAPEFRNSGLAPVFYWETLARGKRQYTEGELSWVDETNKEIIHAIEVMGGKRNKTYRLFEATL